MNIKTYHAPTMREALEMAKSDLGGDAVILHTRCLKRGGFFGFGGREEVEITASSDVRVLPRGPEVRTRKVPRAVERAYNPPAENTSEGGVATLQQEVDSIKTLLMDYVAGQEKKILGKAPGELTALYKLLLRRGIHPDLSRDIIRRLKKPASKNEEKENPGHFELLRSTIAGLIKTSPPIAALDDGPMVAALIGPTGVGKTTTVAKLAANFKLVQGLDVGLVTLDTYRIAAVQQLKTYADIIGIPVNVILTPEELRQARKTFAGKDIILVDTAGRSQRDAKRMDELQVFLDAGNFDQIHLVVSAATNDANLEDIMKRFAPLATDHIIVSKMDEAACPGHVLRVVLESDKRLSYVTTGQEVPDDIEAADAQRFTTMILPEQGGSE
ncbi:MAG: flagellar biosynthesis protein FlhF [Planctomycetota bacterium]